MRNFRNRLILVVISGKVQDTGPPEPYSINQILNSLCGNSSDAEQVTQMDQGLIIQNILKKVQRYILNTIKRYIRNIIRQYLLNLLQVMNRILKWIKNGITI